ncbi:MAG: Fe-S cluster protein, partial [Desulfobacterales bacterium]|nr:Fe-S cluster protein [Desulfobacterales bacterium]
MALSVVDLYRDVLPQTNCGDCGAPTCLAFASKVVSEKHDLGGCPHVVADQLAECKPELEQQYKEGRWTKRDNAADALAWARQRATSMRIEDLPDRIGGRLITGDDAIWLELPYFTTALYIDAESIRKKDGSE